MSNKDTKESRIKTLRQTQKQRQEDAKNRVYQAIERLQKLNAKINFHTISREAQVSVSYLYKYPEIKQHIAELRSQQNSLPVKPVAKPNSTSQGKVITRLQEKIKKIEAENKELKRKCEALAGQVYRAHYLLTKRFLSMHTGIDSQRLMHNQIYEDEYDVLVEGLGNLAELPVIIDDTPAGELTPTRIRSVLRRIQSERGELGLVLLDYIQKLGDRACRNRAQAIGKYSGACKDVAKTFNTPFVVLAQINRGVEGQSNKRPSMADIKDSGDIEQDMDLGLLLYRDEYYNSDTNDKGIMEIIVGKNRNGGTGTCKVQFNPSIGKFDNFDE